MTNNQDINVNFNSSIFLSKANNLIKMIYHFISLGEIDKIKPFVSSNVFSQIENSINKDKTNGEKVNYDEINVSCEIEKTNESDNGVEVVTRATFKYLKYYTSLSDNSFIRGNENNRISVIRRITFKKANKVDMDTYSCFGCGAPINIYNSFICSNCGRPFDFSEFDFIIESIE